MTSELHRRVDEIPGSGEWWHTHNGETFRQLADDLTARGFSDDDAVDLLAAAYGAAADEFGG